MDTDKQYITQLTRQDLKEIGEVVNIHAADGIEIKRKADGLEVSIDRGQLTRWVKTIINGGTI